MGGRMDGWTDGRMSGHKSLAVPGSCHITPRIMLRTTSDTITPNPFTSQVGNRDSQRGNDSYETAEDSRGTATVKAQVRPTWFEPRPTAPVVRDQTHSPQGQSPDPRPPGCPHPPPPQSWGLPKTTARKARRDSHVVKRKGAGNSLGAGKGSPRRPGGVTLLCLSGLGWSDKLGDCGLETVALEEAGCDGGRLTYPRT